jgi:hypothetical protein
MSKSGTVIASVPAAVATDAAGNGNSASTSADNSVTFVTGRAQPPGYRLFLPLVTRCAVPATGP